MNAKTHRARLGLALVAAVLLVAPAMAAPPAVWTTTVDRESYGSTGPCAGGSTPSVTISDLMVSPGCVPTIE